MKKTTESATMTKAEFERLKQRWFLIAGRPIKTAGGLLDKAEAGAVLCSGNFKITRDTKLEDITMEKEDAVEIQRQASRRMTVTDKYMAEVSRCPEVASAYIPPIALAKGSTGQFQMKEEELLLFFYLFQILRKKLLNQKVLKLHN